jgi:hypothetical protein
MPLHNNGIVGTRSASACALGSENESELLVCPSVGSVGHPLDCGLPCKYHRYKGCKLGSSCPRCHLCRYTNKRRHPKSSRTK